MQTDKQEKRIKRGHVALMKHPETALYSGVMLMGNSMVLDEGCPTAYTDGINKFYGRKHLETIPNEAKLRGLILHENLHVALKHCTHGAGMFRESANMANLAADFVVNDITENIKGTIAGTTERIVELYENDVYDPMFHNWSMREVYNYLKKHAKPKPKPRPQNGDKPCDNPTSGGGNDKDNTPPNGGEEPWESVEVNGKTYDLSRADEHRFGGDMTHEQAKEVNDADRKSTRLNSSHSQQSRMPSSA